MSRGSSRKFLEVALNLKQSPEDNTTNTFQQKNTSSSPLLKAHMNRPHQDSDSFGRSSSGTTKSTYSAHNSAASQRVLIRKYHGSPSKMATIKFHVTVGQKSQTYGARRIHSAPEDSSSGDANKSQSSPIGPISLGMSSAPIERAKRFFSMLTRSTPVKDTTSEQPQSRHAYVDPKVRAEREAAKMQLRIEEWANILKQAIILDKQGMVTDAFAAYTRFNRQVTREAINSFEMLTNDQQRLLNHIMLKMDKRITILKISMALECSPPIYKKIEVPANDRSLEDLQESLLLFNKIKMINSKRKIPVVLVYREVKHRTHHRDAKKGKSNKIIFAKEKREFLSVNGLPGKMITEYGLDYTIQPEIDPELNPEDNQIEFEDDDPVDVDKAASESLEETSETKNANLEEIDPDAPEVIPETPLELLAKKNEELAIIRHCLGLRKKVTASPTLGRSTMRNNEGHQYHSIDTLNNAELSEDSTEVEEDDDGMLSCDSCSSNESANSDFEDESHTDMAVLGNYIHKESVEPAPFIQEDDERGYLTLALEMVGVKKTARLSSTYLRISVRDTEGHLLDVEQETATWDIINKNYLRAPGPVFLQKPLEELPEDAAIFFEIRHFIKAKRKVSTLCYTFLEKIDFVSGEYICELYKPPVQFCKKNLVPYTTKAFFLHFDLKVTKPEEEEEEEEEEGEEEEESKEEELNMNDGISEEGNGNERN